ncbi:MAG TPA: heavy metal translocating P-type ATPase [Pseudomonadales bacterium]|nr:heavy metal translocating P-type ATPase [Pseudomonadales bacterium]
MPVDTTTCFHCNEQLARDNPQKFSATIAGAVKNFCCPACLTVTNTIYQLGLEQYYQQRDQKPQNPVAIPQDFSDMDIEASHQDFVHLRRDGKYEAQFFIADIHCASCCWLIEKHLANIAGVEEAQVHLNNHKLTLRWHDSNLRISNIFRALANIGYRALPWQPAQQQEHAQLQQRQLLQRLGVAGILGMQIHMIAMGSYFGADSSEQHWQNWVALLLSLPIWFYCADIFFRSAWRSIQYNIRVIFSNNTSGFHPPLSSGMDLPIALAIIAAAIASVIALLLQSSDVYFDSIAMLVFILTAARYLELRSHNRMAEFSQQPVLPQYCTRIIDSMQERISIHNLKINDTIYIAAGNVIATDGMVIEGVGSAEEAAITGEFTAVQKNIGDTVIAGTTLTGGELWVRVHSWGLQSHLAQLHQRMEAALLRKHATTPYDRAAFYFTPLVLLIAIASGLFWCWTEPGKALPAFLAVLVASCPCALSLAIPAALSAATLQLRRQGILLSNNQVLHQLPQTHCFVFDKTGTLTQGRMAIVDTKIHGNLSAETCLSLACALESQSSHPVASAFHQHQRTTNPVLPLCSEIRHIVHCGIEGRIDNKLYRIGKLSWCIDACNMTNHQDFSNANNANMIIALSDNNGLLASFTLGDTLRADAKTCLTELQAPHQNHCSILSGDHSSAVTDIARQLAIKDIHQNCTPTEKVSVLTNLKQQYGSVMMVGDGINDGPVLAHADISVALAEASQTAQLAADVILLNNRLSDILVLRAMAMRTRNITRQNIAWALLYNISILPLAATGLLPPVVAAIGMALSSLLVSGNAVRLLAHKTSITKQA